MSETEQLSFVSGALALRRACDPEQSPEAMLDRMVAILRDFIAFDIATFVEYAEDRSGPDSCSLVRGRYAVENGQRFEWPARWVKVPSALMTSINANRSAVPDFDVLLEKSPFKELRDHEVVKLYQDREAHSFVRAMFREGGRPVCSLSLARKAGAPRPLSDRDQETLDGLELADTLRLVRIAYKADAANFRQEIRNLFAEKTSPEQIAQTAVEKFCVHFRWDYVSIYRLSYARERFELLVQHNSTQKPRKPLEVVDDRYTQPFAHGVLGEVLETGKPTYVEDTAKRPRYLNVEGLKARSCLIYPMIVLDGEIEWIIDCESSEVGAFQKPDVEELAALVEEGQASFARWFEMRLNKALIENVEQGIVVVDQKNRITRLNGLADTLLGGDSLDSQMEDTKESVIGDVLSTFGENEKDRDTLAKRTSATSIHLVGKDKIIRHAVVSSSDTEEPFSRRIWRLTDTGAWNWVTAIEYMRATVRGVAQQTRGPLLLANALLAKAFILSDDKSELRKIVVEARASLAKTDITYERLAERLTVEQNPMPPIAVDVMAEINRFVGQLPEEDSKAVVTSCPSPVPAVWSDPDRVRFVLHSTIGYLLAVHVPSSPLSIRIENGNGSVGVTLSSRVRGAAFTAADPSESDTLARATADAVEAVTHALSTVRKVILSSRGAPPTITQNGGQLTVHFALPVCSAAEAGFLEGGQDDG